MALLTGKSDFLNLYLRLIDTIIKALSKLFEISMIAGCPYLSYLKLSLDSMYSFKDGRPRRTNKNFFIFVM